MKQNLVEPSEPREPVTTVEAARMLGMAVRSVQLMVDRGELQAWKTPGGHRRISRDAIERWLAARAGTGSPEAVRTAPDERPVPAARPRVLLIEDSVHFQNMVGLLVRRHFPEVELHVASDGITGLVMVGELRPDVLIVDILLPGIDGATLVTSLRNHPRYGRSHILVITSLDAAELATHAFALEGIPVVHKSRIVTELPSRMAQALVEEGG